MDCKFRKISMIILSHPHIIKKRPNNSNSIVLTRFRRGVVFFLPLQYGLWNGIRISSRWYCSENLSIEYSQSRFVRCSRSICTYAAQSKTHRHSYFTWRTSTFTEHRSGLYIVRSFVHFLLCSFYSKTFVRFSNNQKFILKHEKWKRFWLFKSQRLSRHSYMNNPSKCA